MAINDYFSLILIKQTLPPQGCPLYPLYGPRPTSSGKVFVLKRNMVPWQFTWTKLFLWNIVLLEKQKTEEKKKCPSCLKLESLCKWKIHAFADTSWQELKLPAPASRQFRIWRFVNERESFPKINVNGGRIRTEPQTHISSDSRYGNDSY